MKEISLTGIKPTSHQLFEIYKLFATSEEIKLFEEKFKRELAGEKSSVKKPMNI